MAGGHGISGLDRDLVRRRWLGIARALVIGVFVADLVAVPAVLMRQHEAALDTRGRRTTAVVISTQNRGRWFPDSAEVRYLVDGRQVQTRLTVSSDTLFSEGSSIAIIYDPQHPEHAKPVEGWQPSYLRLVLAAAVVLAAVVVVLGKRAVVTLLALRSVHRANASSLMRAESFTTKRGWWTWSSHFPWAALWSGDTNAASGPSQLVVPIEDSNTELRADVRVTVLGRPEARQYLVIVDGDRVVWPRGRARRDRPGGKIVEGRVG